MEKEKKVTILQRRDFFYLQNAGTDERLMNCNGSDADGAFETKEAAVESAEYHGYEIIG